MRSNQTDWCMRAPSGTTQASQISTGKTQTHNRKHKNTHKYTIAPKYLQLTLSIGWKTFTAKGLYCSVKLWICEQSHPNLPLPLRTAAHPFLLHLLPLHNHLRSPIFHPSFFSAPTSKNHDCLCSHILTLHSSHSTTLLHLSWVHNLYNLHNESWIMKVHCHDEERTTKVWCCHIAMVGLTGCCGQWWILFKR